MYTDLGHKGGMGHAVASLAHVAQQQCDYERAEALAEDSLALLRPLGDRHVTGWVTRILAEVVPSRGDVPRAMALLQESLRLAQLVGDAELIAAALDDVGDVARTQAPGTAQVLARRTSLPRVARRAFPNGATSRLEPPG